MPQLGMVLADNWEVKGIFVPGFSEDFICSAPAKDHRMCF